MATSTAQSPSFAARRLRQDLANPSTGAASANSVATIAALRALSVPGTLPGGSLVVHVNEHTAGTGKGGGLFRWNATSTAADDNGRTINLTGNAGAGRFERAELRITVEQFGAVGDGTAVDSAIIQTVLTKYNAGPFMTPVYLESPSYKCSAGITVNSTFVTLIGNDSLLDFTGTVGVVGLTLNASVSPDGGNHYGRKAAVEGLRLKGPANRATDGSIGVKFDSAVALSTPGSLLHRVMCFNWDIGHQHANSSYISAGYHCEIYACRTSLDSIPGTDAGERITYIDSTIYNSNLALRSTKQLTFFHLVTCSVDYCNKIAELKGGEAMLVNCHVEGNGASYGVNPPIELTGDGSSFVMQGGRLLMQTAAQFSAWADVGANSYCKIAPDFAFNCLTVASGTALLGFWFTGAGRYEVEYGQSYNNSNNPEGLANGNGRLADPGLESNSLAQDLRFITSDTSAITNAFTGANIILTTSPTIVRSGAVALRVQKVGGNGSNASCVLAAIPIRPGRKAGGTFWLRKPGTSTGTLFLEYRFFRLDYLAGIPSMTRSLTAGAFSNVVLTAADTGWIRGGRISQTLSACVAPQWATHVGLFFNGVSWVGLNDFVYFDDFVLDEVG